MIHQLTHTRSSRFLIDFFQENIKFLLDEPAIDDELYSIAVNLIKRLGIIDAEEFSMVRGGIENPAVLVFLPGINEINRMRSVLMDKWQNSLVNIIAQSLKKPILFLVSPQESCIEIVVRCVAFNVQRSSTSIGHATSRTKCSQNHFGNHHSRKFNNCARRQIR